MAIHVSIDSKGWKKLIHGETSMSPDGNIAIYLQDIGYGFMLRTLLEAIENFEEKTGQSPVKPEQYEQIAQSLFGRSLHSETQVEESEFTHAELEDKIKRRDIKIHDLTKKLRECRELLEQCRKDLKMRHDL